MLLKFIDNSLDSFDVFLSQYAHDGSGKISDFHQYTDFLYSQYSQAVNGIVKTDFPSEADVIGGISSYLNSNWAGLGPVLIDDPVRNSQPYWGGSPPDWLSSYSLAAPGSGTAFNMSYGAADKFPRYGVYEPPPTSVSPSIFLSNLGLGMDTTQINEMEGVWWWADAPILTVQQQQGLWSFWVMSTKGLTNWVVPWVQNIVIIRAMARWKAIYLYNGYDKVWSLLQTLQSLVTPNPGIVPPTMHLDQDGMIANAHWSARELCTVLKVEGQVARFNGVGNPEDSLLVNHPLPGDPGGRGYSVFKLLRFLDNIANGSWGGPFPYRAGALRPISFRKELAAVALWQEPSWTQEFVGP
jgi:hypothetical protein